MLLLLVVLVLLLCKQMSIFTKLKKIYKCVKVFKIVLVPSSRNLFYFSTINVGAFLVPSLRNLLNCFSTIIVKLFWYHHCETFVEPFLVPLLKNLFGTIIEEPFKLFWYHHCGTFLKLFDVIIIKPSGIYYFSVWFRTFYDINL